MNSQEVPQGYKKTKVGVIPEYWETINFSSLAEFRNGLNFTRKNNGEAIKIVGVGNFKKHSVLPTLKDLDIINVSTMVKENDLIKKNDVLYVRSNGNKNLIGRCLYFPQVDEKVSFSGFTIRGRIISPLINSEYFALLSNSKIVKKQFSSNGAGTNISNLSQQILNDVLIPLPPLKEQKKIAKILTTWDDAISKQEELIKAKEQLKKGLMQKLLSGEIRFDGFSGKWEEVRLGNICKITTGKLNANAMIENGKYTFFTCAKESYKIDIFAFDTEALLVSGNGANVGYIHYFKGKFNAYQRTYVLDKFQDNIMLIKYLLDKYLSFQINREKNDGNTPYITLPTLTKMKLKLPPLQEQQKLAQVLSTADKEIELLKNELESLKEQKKGLMQRLLTGEVRVKG